MPTPHKLTRPLIAGALALAVLLGASSALAASPQTTLPSEVSAALARAKVPRDAVSLLVVDAEGKQPARLSHRSSVPVNPASVMKLVTTFAGLDLLGPAFTWSTPVYIEGAVRDGTLYGNLHIRGQGDPKLVTERLWLLLRRVQGLGVKTIAGNIVLDRRAFDVATQDAGSFDGEPGRPYNASPDALLINFKSVVMTFVPDPTSGMARISYEPPLAGVQLPARVPLTVSNNGNGHDCGDYRSALKADFSDPARIRFAGTFDANCGEKVWSVAYADPASFAARAVEGLWREMGGQLGGRVLEGHLPAWDGAPGSAAPRPAFEIASPALAEVIRDINKYSNNVMAQQLFLTLSQQQNGVGSFQASRERLQAWWPERIGGPDAAPVLENGSGLSRNERISAGALGRLLQTAYASPQMPELMSSLPISGVDGTLKRVRSRAAGSAHLKTGSLRDVAAVAGYVLGASGKRYVLVAIVNYPGAVAARPAIDALVEWAMKD
jgi:D-alanyl-D-alanine carboxypeptidase/D-alanyl-D-alanine-endopeptidase (penicillin-binding protein 4)